ncbi:MAG: peptidase [Chloroflexota bacterium]|nr:peptidase [Chloroflexota bacterium]
MTFCIGMKVAEGLVGIADTRVTSGMEWITARKVVVLERTGHTMFIMTSGLRSARDKALTYFDEVLEDQDASFDKLYKAVNAFAEQVRRVTAEDKKALVDSGLDLNLYCIIGGQLEKDREHKLYLLYPQANWVEVAQGTPYYVIGESSYGKPLLDRALSYETSMETALKLGYLAFDATRIAAVDVDFPIDVVMYRTGSYHITQHRYTAEELKHISQEWQEKLLVSVNQLPGDWMRVVLENSRIDKA